MNEGENEQNNKKPPPCPHEQKTKREFKNTTPPANNQIIHKTTISTCQLFISAEYIFVNISRKQNKTKRAKEQSESVTHCGNRGDSESKCTSHHNIQQTS